MRGWLLMGRLRHASVALLPWLRPRGLFHVCPTADPICGTWENNSATPLERPRELAASPCSPMGNCPR